MTIIRNVKIFKLDIIYANLVVARLGWYLRGKNYKHFINQLKT
jgi:hypothetical protein